MLMRAGQAKMPKSGSVRAQLVSRQQFRHEALFPEQLAHEPECRALVAAALNQHVENPALVIVTAELPCLHLHGLGKLRPRFGGKLSARKAGVGPKASWSWQLSHQAAN